MQERQKLYSACVASLFLQNLPGFKSYQVQLSFHIKKKPSYAVTECGSGAELASAERSQSDHPRAHLMASTWWGWLLPLSQKGLRGGEKGKERDGPEVYGSTHLQS